MISMILTIREFFEKMKRDRVGVYAAQASFFMLLSLFPLLMLLLSIVSFSGFSQDYIFELKNFLPEVFTPLYETIVLELYSKSSGTILSVTAVIALWSASKGVLSILKGLNEIFDINEDKHFIYLRAISLFYLLLFLVAFVLALVLLVFGNWIYRLTLIYAPVIGSIVSIFLKSRFLIACLILTILFTFMYRMVRNPDYQFKDCFLGALFSSLGWMIFSSAFSYYAGRFADYSYMYGSLSSVIMFMLWMYFCFYIFFIGAELSTIIKKNKKN